jgi:hypothetical protein
MIDSLFLMLVMDYSVAEYTASWGSTTVGPASVSDFASRRGSSPAGSTDSYVALISFTTRQRTFRSIHSASQHDPHTRILQF